MLHEETRDRGKPLYIQCILYYRVRGCRAGEGLTPPAEWRRLLPEVFDILFFGREV
ncbi:MAG: hypothetical protein JWO52_1420 [Gammaproteobacteria bacterium]|nr:hypothetical protein [Gammaproteobacteria bacterium]